MHDDRYNRWVGSGMVCEDCKVLVFNTEVHDQHHAKLQGLLEMAADAHRMADHADSLTRPIGG